MRAGNSISDYPGKKDQLINEYRRFMPSDRINTVYETHAGTLSVTRNLLKPELRANRYIATELDRGMYCLLHQIQTDPERLVNALHKSEYSQLEFDIAKLIESDGWEDMSETAVAYCRYVLLNQSFNASCKSWRGYTVANERRYFSNIENFIFNGNDELQGIELINEDMMKLVDDYLCMEDAFIFIDSPYENSLRSESLYAQETTSDWHDDFLKKIRDLKAQNKLHAKVMICGYCNENLAADKYNKSLLTSGFTLYKVKDTIRPTVIREGMCPRKGTASEYIWINYEPMDRDSILSENIYTYQRVFGTHSIKI